MSIGVLGCTLLLMGPVTAIAETWGVDAAGGGDYATIEEAIAAAASGDEIVVEPGTYYSPVSDLYDFAGKALTLRSSQGPEVTFLDGSLSEVVLYLGTGEGADSVVDGFTIQNAPAGGIYLYGTSPTLRNLRIVHNDDGYGWCGGGLYAEGGAPTLLDSIVEDNTSPADGAGICIVNSSLRIVNTQIKHNIALGNGGGIFATGPDQTLTLENVSLLDNRGYHGGGLSVATTLRATNLLVAGNTAFLLGGGLHCSLSSVALTNATFVDNGGPGGGGAIASDLCEGPISNSILAYNKSARGGVVREVGATDLPLLTFYYSDFFENGNAPFEGVSEPLEGDNLLLEPGFLHLLNDLKTDGDDYHLAPDSPLRDAGYPDPAFEDQDGSRNNLGMFGGPSGDLSYEADDDLDQMFDGWERLHGLDAASNDSVFDADLDGLTNLQEFQASTFPEVEDTDRDGQADGDEIRAGSDPNDAFDPISSATLPSDRFPTIQSALEVAKDGVLLLVSPGTYTEVLNFLGHDVTLRSLEGKEVTTLRNNYVAPVVSFVYGETSNARLEGFTLSEGWSDLNGGGIQIFASSPTLENLFLYANAALGNGGGISVEEGQPSLSQLRFEANECVGSGGALSLSSSTVTLIEATFKENEAWGYGGAISSDHSALSLENVTLQLNAAMKGGALRMTGGEVVGLDLTSLDHSTSNAGGHILVEGGSLSLTRATLQGGGSSSDGGALATTGTSNVTLRQTTINGTSASYGGALCFRNGATALLDHVTLAGCFADTYGGALMAEGATVVLENSILAFNRASLGGGVYAASYEVTDSTTGETTEYPSEVRFAFTDVFGNRQSDVVGADLPSEELGNLSVDPEFVSFVDDLAVGDDDLHLRPTSPLIDAADPASERDPDGSLPDMGAYGGADADMSFYADSDGDGMADGYEVALGLDPEVPDASADPDGDGLTNLEEVSVFSSPFLSDTDSDGLSDSEEFDEGSDPTDPYSPKGYVTVPDVVSSIQEAIRLASDGQEIRVLPGVYHESLDFLGKNIRLVGESRDTCILEGTGMGSIITLALAEGQQAVIEHFTLRLGGGAAGGAIYLYGTSPTLNDLLLTNNTVSSSGGGMAVISGSPRLTSIEFLGNSAGSSGLGGALYLNGSSPMILQCIFEANSASSGGAIHSEASSGIIQGALVVGNEALNGGGITARGGTTVLTVTQATIHSNEAAGGAGLMVDSSLVYLHNSLVTGNRAPEGAGILVRGSSTVTVSYSDVFNNKGANYGGDVLLDQTGVNENTSEDPRFQAWSDDGLWSNDDLHLRPDSPSRHGGDPLIENADGSVSDRGFYGGPSGDLSYYEDGDGDDMYDGWETTWGLETTLDDGGLDVDGDGLTNEQEFQAGTDPTEADSDGDERSDAQELTEGTDPLDFFSPVDTIVVTDYFETIQEAINAARDGVTLLLAKGTYQELIDFGGKEIALSGLGLPEETVLDGAGAGPVVAMRYGEGEATRLERLSIKNGAAPDGAGMRLVSASPTLDRLIISSNTAENAGGGISMVNGAPKISNTVIMNNSATYGAGIRGRSVQPALTGVTIVGNTASDSGGGFSCIDQCSVALFNNIVAYNTALRGGGVHIVVPFAFAIENNDVYGNTPENYYGSIGDQTNRKGNISLDPLFETWGDAELPPDLRLQPESPALEAGTDVSDSAYLLDLLGVTRPFDGDGDGEALFDMGALEYELDLDEDGYGISQGDCGEGDPLVYPGAREVCGDTIDQDCDGEDLDCNTVDDDLDGFTELQGDCNDADFQINPGVEELENGVDDNCDGEIDEGFTSLEPSPTPEVDTGCSCDGGGQSGRGAGGRGWGGEALLLLGIGRLLRRKRR